MAGFMEGDQAGLPKPVGAPLAPKPPRPIAAPPAPTALRPRAGGFDPNAYLHPEQHMPGAAAPAPGVTKPMRPPVPAGPMAGGNMRPGMVANRAARQMKRMGTTTPVAPAPVAAPPIAAPTTPIAPKPVDWRSAPI